MSKLTKRAYRFEQTVRKYIFCVQEILNGKVGPRSLCLVVSPLSLFFLLHLAQVMVSAVLQQGISLEESNKIFVCLFEPKNIATEWTNMVLLYSEISNGFWFINIFIGKVPPTTREKLPLE